jgi:hypothetical protein
MIDTTPILKAVSRLTDRELREQADVYLRATPGQLRAVSEEEIMTRLVTLGVAGDRLPYDFDTYAMELARKSLVRERQHRHPERVLGGVPLSGRADVDSK